MTDLEEFMGADHINPVKFWYIINDEAKQHAAKYPRRKHNYYMVFLDRFNSSGDIVKSLSEVAQAFGIHSKQAALMISWVRSAMNHPIRKRQWAQ